MEFGDIIKKETKTNSEGTIVNTEYYIGQQYDFYITANIETKIKPGGSISNTVTDIKRTRLSSSVEFFDNLAKSEME